MGNYPVKTYLKITNNTIHYFDIRVYSVDNYDFYDSRPDVNFQDVRIYSNYSVERTEEIAHKANYSAFEMYFYFEDGSSDHFRIHQQVTIGCCSGFQHFRKSHRIYYDVNEYTKTLHIKVYHTEEQLENQRAEQLNKEGQTSFGIKQYATAINKYQQARRNANEYSTIRKIDENLKRAEKAVKAQKLFEEGKKLATTKNYEKALNKLEESLKLSEDQSEIANIKKQKSITLKEKEENDEAKKLNREGEEAMLSKNFEIATKKFEASLRLAHTETLLKKIRNNTAANLDAYARHMYEEAWRLEEDENEDKSAEAEDRFETAKRLFQKRNNEKYVNLVDTKIKGNVVFNEALSIEVEATILKDNKNFQDSQVKFRHALTKYEEALQKFQEGMKAEKRFTNSVQFVQKQIKNVESRIADIKQEELSMNIKRVTVEAKPKRQDAQMDIELEQAQVVL